MMEDANFFVPDSNQRFLDQYASAELLSD